MSVTLAPGEFAIIAISVPKERQSVANGTMFYWYRVKHLTYRDWEDLHREGKTPLQGGFVPYVVEHQLIHEGDQPKTFDWEVWAFGETPQAAIEEVIGDHYFLGAVSLHPWHENAKQSCLEERRLRKAVSDGKDAVHTAEAAVCDLKSLVNSELAKKSKGKTDEQCDALFERLKKKHSPTMAILMSRRKEADYSLNQAEDDLAIFLARKKHPSIHDETLIRLIEGKSAIVSGKWLDEMLEEHPEFYYLIRTCRNNQQCGILDEFVAWIRIDIELNSMPDGQLRAVGSIN